MTNIPATSVMASLNNHRTDLAARLNVGPYFVDGLLTAGDRHNTHRLSAAKFRVLVDFYEDLGFENRTALRLARYGIGPCSANPDRYYAVIDGQLTGSTSFHK